jgi:predicted enzyme related to lactoylglutathione lyase
MPDLLVNIDVSDLEKAIEFYSAALGLQLARRLGPDIAEMHGRSAPIYLIRHASGIPPFPSASQGREYTRHWTPVHLDFVVHELGSSVARARAAGAHAESEVREFGGGRYVVLSDPFGNGFCLIEFAGRGYTEVA